MKRIVEFDLLKGIAVTSMVTFHFFYLSNMMSLSNYNISSGKLYFLAKMAQIIFITSVGLNLSAKKTKNKNDKKKFYTNQVKRLFKLFLVAMLISFTTKQIFGDILYVKFGILHFISLGSLLSLAIIKYKYLIYLVFFLNYLLIYIIPKISHLCNNEPFVCFILGIKNLKYSALDHFPLLNFYPYILLGIILGNNYYKKLESKLDWLPKYITNNIITKKIANIGKHSFEIYISHFIIFYLYFKFKGGIPKKIL